MLTFFQIFNDTHLFPKHNPVTMHRNSSITGCWQSSQARPKFPFKAPTPPLGSKKMCLAFFNIFMYLHDIFCNVLIRCEYNIPIDSAPLFEWCYLIFFFLLLCESPSLNQSRICWIFLADTSTLGICRTFCVSASSQRQTNVYSPTVLSTATHCIWLLTVRYRLISRSPRSNNKNIFSLQNPVNHALIWGVTACLQNL